MEAKHLSGNVHYTRIKIKKCHLVHLWLFLEQYVTNILIIIFYQNNLDRILKMRIISKLTKLRKTF